MLPRVGAAGSAGPAGDADYVDSKLQLPACCEKNLLWIVVKKTLLVKVVIKRKAHPSPFHLEFLGHGDMVCVVAEYLMILRMTSRPYRLQLPSPPHTFLPLTLPLLSSILFLLSLFFAAPFPNTVYARRPFRASDVHLSSLVRHTA